MLIFLGASACTAPKFYIFTEANLCVLSLVQCAAQHRHQTILMCMIIIIMIIITIMLMIVPARQRELDLAVMHLLHQRTAGLVSSNSLAPGIRGLH